MVDSPAAASNAGRGIKRTKSIKRKKLREPLHPDMVSPMKRQLEETETWTKSELGSFAGLRTTREKTKFVYELLPFDATGLDRLWPIQIVQKDSRIRRKLSDKGKELFISGDWEQALHHYNEACLFSSEKGKETDTLYYLSGMSWPTWVLISGLGHTLARRAAFLLQVDQVDLAIRDIKLAFELGCLGSELLDFLLAHHTTDDTVQEAKDEASVERSVEALYDPDVPGDRKNMFVAKLKADLEKIKSSSRGRRTPTSESVALITEHIKNLVNIHSEELNARQQQREATDSIGDCNDQYKLLDADERHLIYPSLASSVDVVVDNRDNKGRRLVAQMELDVGEIVAIEEPNTILFCPNSKLVLSTNYTKLSHSHYTTLMLIPTFLQLPLLKNHCLHCLNHSIAPLPCPDCCSVSFCSVRCQQEANSTYHKYECKMKLYEMLHFMGDEHMDIFMAIRTITQRPLKYFMERKDRIWSLLAREHPEESSTEIINLRIAHT